MLRRDLAHRMLDALLVETWIKEVGFLTTTTHELIADPEKIHLPTGKPHGWNEAVCGGAIVPSTRVTDVVDVATCERCKRGFKGWSATIGANYGEAIYVGNGVDTGGDGLLR